MMLAPTGLPLGHFGLIFAELVNGAGVGMTLVEIMHGRGDPVRGTISPIRLLHDQSGSCWSFVSRSIA